MCTHAKCHDHCGDVCYAIVVCMLTLCRVTDRDLWDVRRGVEGSLGGVVVKSGELIVVSTGF